MEGERGTYPPRESPQPGAAARDARAKLETADSLARRLAYAGAAPLLPAVLTWRTLAGWRRAARRQEVPLLTLPAMLLGNTVQATGEALGYLRGAAGKGAEEIMTRYEIRKVDYATRQGL